MGNRFRCLTFSIIRDTPPSPRSYIARTAILFINGAPAGSVQFLPDGTPVVSPNAWKALDRLPVTLLPFLEPQATMRTLVGLSGRDIVVPRLGTIRVEVHR